MSQVNESKYQNERDVTIKLFEEKENVEHFRLVETGYKWNHR